MSVVQRWTELKKPNIYQRFKPGPLGQEAIVLPPAPPPQHVLNKFRRLAILDNHSIYKYPYLINQQTVTAAAN